MATILTLLTSLLASLAMVAVVRRVATRYHIGALPSVRKIHTDFKPLLGGIGIFAGIIAGMLAANLAGAAPFDSWMSNKFFWLGLLAALLLGFIDDVRGVNAWQKFAGQFLAAALAVQGGCLIEAFYNPGGGTLALGWFGYPFTILWIIFIINAVNLLDGLDGLAGGISLIIAAGFFIISLINNQLYLSILSLALIGGLLGFLRYNYHPASIFMGDVGSLMLGYLLACLSIETLKVAQSQQVYFLASLVMLGMPLTDTLISFFRRMGRGDHPFKPDREHVHHRLIKLGLCHLDSVWMMYYFTLLYVTLGVLMVLYWDRLAGSLLFLLAFIFSLYWAWRLGYLETRRYISFGIGEQEIGASLRPPIHVGRIWHQIALLIGDIFSAGLAVFLVFWFRFKSGILEPPGDKPLNDYLAQPVLFVLVGFWLLLFWLNDLYRMPWDVSRYDKFLRVTRVITFGTIFLLIFFNLNILMTPNSGNPLNTSQVLTLGLYWLAMVVLVNGVRLLIINIEKRRHIFEYSYKNTLLIGATRQGRNIIRDICVNPHLLNRIVGIVDRKPTIPEFEGFPVLGSYRDLPQLIREHNIEEIIVAVNEGVRQDFLEIIGICDRLQVVVKTLPGLQTIVSSHTPELAGQNLVRVFPEYMVLWQWAVKRFIDVIFAGALLLLTLPFWVALNILVRKQFGKPALARIPILGKNGRIFTMYLFRMSKPGEAGEAIYHGEVEKTPLSPLGQFLYRTRLYKMPQLLNVLKGDMSVVGPRPESPEWYRKNQHRLQFLHRRLMVRPGITGIAQFKYRFFASHKMLRERLKYDIFYSENISINLDLRIILRSIFLFFRSRPAKGSKKPASQSHRP